jgi:hypothetical protein
MELIVKRGGWYFYMDGNNIVHVYDCPFDHPEREWVTSFDAAYLDTMIAGLKAVKQHRGRGIKQAWK